MGHIIRRLNPCIVSHRSAVWSHNTTYTKTRAAVAASMRCECDADDGRLERFKTTTEITFEISQGHYYWCYSIIGADFRFEVPGQSSVGTHRRRKGSVVGGHHGECGARAYNEGLGAEPPAGSRGRSPPEAESILVIGCPTEPANLPL